MKDQIIGIAVNFVVTGLLGYCIAMIKNNKKRNNATNNALKIMLQTNLTNTYFVYSNEKRIPDYIYRNWINMLDEYEKLDGDDYIHVLADKMKTWEIIRTDILNN